MRLTHATILFCGSLAVYGCKTGEVETSGSGLKDLQDGNTIQEMVRTASGSKPTTRLHAILVGKANS